MKKKDADRLQSGRMSRSAILYRIGKLAHLLSLKIESGMSDGEVLDGDISELLGTLESYRSKPPRPGY